MQNYQDLIDALIEEEYLVKPRIIEAFRNTPRKDYLRSRHRMLEGINSPLPIGKEQTISQPATVSIMLHILDPSPGDTVLEIGYGSGWQTALIARMVCAPKNKDCGDVYAYEIIPSIAKFGRENLERSLPKSILSHIHLFPTDYEDSFEKYAPYDKIIAAAAFRTNPTHLIENLGLGGRIVFPTYRNDIRRITRKTKQKYVEEIFPGFIFVPITH